ncbi:MAG: hypothetical protein [Microviridae sp.]|nr:MAG: hypothetical protein [Microviridae sp.]
MYPAAGASAAKPTGLRNGPGVPSTRPDNLRTTVSSLSPTIRSISRLMVSWYQRTYETSLNGFDALAIAASAVLCLTLISACATSLQVNTEISTGDRTITSCFSMQDSATRTPSRKISKNHRFWLNSGLLERTKSAP